MKQVVQVWRCDVQGFDEIFCPNSQFLQLIHVRAHYLLQSFSDEQAEDPPSNQNEPQTDCDSDSDQNKGNDSKNPLELLSGGIRSVYPPTSVESSRFMMARSIWTLGGSKSSEEPAW